MDAMVSMLEAKLQDKRQMESKQNVTMESNLAEALEQVKALQAENLNREKKEQSLRLELEAMKNKEAQQVVPAKKKDKKDKKRKNESSEQSCSYSSEESEDDPSKFVSTADGKTAPQQQSTGS